MAYELWSLESHNLLAEFASEAAALTCMRAVATAQGEPYASAFALLFERADGESELVAEGVALVERAGATSELAPASVEVE